MAIAEMETSWPLTDLPAGETKMVKSGNREILLINTGTGIYALDNSCIHGGCRLSNGKLEGENLRCPCHSSLFRAATGDVIEGPATSRQPVVAVTVWDGRITLAP